MKRIGRRYELELKRLLEEHGWHVIDVASNAGLTGTFDADLLVWPPGHTPTEGWQYREDPAMLEMEVKYRKDATGFGGLYDAHLETVGLGTSECILWGDHVCTGGIVSLRQYITRTRWLWEEGSQTALTAFTKKAFKPGVKVVACRASRKPWVFIWKEGI